MRQARETIGRESSVVYMREMRGGGLLNRADFYGEDFGK